MGKKVYAIKEGFDFQNNTKIKNKIVNTWADCLKYVKGVKGAQYKSFESVDAAEAYLSEGSKMLKKSEENYPKDCLHIYVDGSYNIETEKYAYGLVAVRNNVVEYIESDSSKDKGEKNIRQIAGELEAAVRATKYALENGEKKVVIFHDYEGISHHATGFWERREESSINYYNKMKELMTKGIEVIFVKVDSHTGDFFNELVDEKCKEKIKLASDKVVARWLLSNKLKVLNESVKEEILKVAPNSAKSIEVIGEVKPKKANISIQGGINMKLGIIGAGKIVKDFLSASQLLKNLKLAAIYGRKSSEQKLEELKSKYEIDSIFYDYNELLNSDVDTVYIALPNNLHFEFAKKALEANKNVIVEKPITSNYKEALILSDLARKRNLFIFEAITNQYLPNYKKIKKLLPTLGNIKIVQCNYSQYSSRYDSFKAGKVLPAFDPNFSGGALMDLNIYNIHYVVGLFGKPKNVEYYPNIDKGIDTSGVLILEYETFKCVCIGAKDCKAPIANNIQGDKGCIYQDSPTNVCKSFELLMNDGTSTLINKNNYEHRMVNEFIEFIDMIQNNNLETCYKMLNQSLIVSEIQTIARSKGGIKFASE